jgi:hypothetical protein
LCQCFTLISACAFSVAYSTAIILESRIQA